MKEGEKGGVGIRVGGGGGGGGGGAGVSSPLNLLLMPISLILYQYFCLLIKSLPNCILARFSVKFFFHTQCNITCEFHCKDFRLKEI